jgi:hypothetical protein
VSSYSDLAWVLAPKYFVLVDENDLERAPSGLLRSLAPALDAGKVRPVFESPETAREFADAYYADEDSARIRVGQMDALVLAGLCDGTRGVGLAAFVFDPEAASVEHWSGTQRAMSVGYYGRSVAELSSGLEKLMERAEAALGPDSEDSQNARRVRA